MHIINKDYDAAMKDLVSAAELDPKFSCAIGQKLYIEYQQLLMINDIAKKNAALKGIVCFVLALFELNPFLSFQSLKWQLKSFLNQMSYCSCFSR